eukprot:TRINITY_DN17758_c0_g1_i2.p1 TRINITY_DN17758_c0_g1~~TRINITY_DN17758_c0_g1_i2.p1  ORF type:complete len:234 (+),score=25.51 TRINITY_DN17758_c0_g1_i2:244-945(+)
MKTGRGDADRNEARIEPWIERELQTVLELQDVSLLVTIVMATVDFPEEAASQLQGFLSNADLEHFLHELRCFVQSGMDMELYDNSVSYVVKPNNISEQAVLAHNTAICSAPPRGTAQRMMHSMGWNPGEGLGRESDGITEPVHAVANHKKSGLGAQIRANPNPNPNPHPSRRPSFLPGQRPTINTRFLDNTLKQQARAGNQGVETGHRNKRHKGERIEKNALASKIACRTRKQ